ncbi:D-alanyl-D-alanine carboxypeptidase/D-alanyl-D-alanine endopeptidase [Paraliomyxa miuraensis]|uniref:D-alanyl-D-alanine carboxypeptidase/D-alanyl-D-alanine endopeptidase n=1 Tax=Paraliomyxa miuraensis TaxID=376150 RepID=UPI00225BD4D1|nr:D-alanyl-D-alanine carboxypeptidase/D-alanyl-D-alanine-endopeptidase [Paraliomyxa miuraensis]MCX4242429.1 D-alanyl-D-alanine carboxypeptidase/D-alanyl-D-alanine-endopeptidase [Paraliomyxa miuraensis]
MAHAVFDPPRHRSRRLGLCAALLGALLSWGTGPDLGGRPARALAPGPAEGSSAPALVAEIDAALAKRFLAEAQVGVSVVDLETGEVLYQRGDTVPLNPASNVKLVTTASALGLLGPAHRYATGLYHDDGALSGSTIKGDLYLRGSGDPSLVSADLYELVETLHARGIKRITGGIVVDATCFDRDELPPGFDQKQELASYRAPSGCMSVDFNTFEVHVRPAEGVGSPPFAGVVPPVEGITLGVEATTASGRRRSLFADYEDDGPAIALRLRGTVGVGSSATTLRYPVVDPSTHAGQVLASLLRRGGIKVGRSRITTGKVPAKAPLVAAHASAPLSVLVRSVNKLSNNFMAEQILKTIDQDSSPATFDGALGRVRAHLAALGVPSEGLSLGNGSGLYDTNRISPAQLTALLSAVYADLRVRPDFLASLAIMGVDGTTRSRLRKSSRAGWIRAKTGTLDGVSALSGYAGAPDRDPIAFSILFNGLRRADTSQARAVQNEIVELLARHAAGLPLSGEARSKSDPDDTAEDAE